MHVSETISQLSNLAMKKVRQRFSAYKVKTYYIQFHTKGPSLTNLK
jgi:hypothetical protein